MGFGTCQYSGPEAQWVQGSGKTNFVEAIRFLRDLVTGGHAFLRSKVAETGWLAQSLFARADRAPCDAKKALAKLLLNGYSPTLDQEPLTRMVELPEIRKGNHDPFCA
jgi:hypothetical protein